MMSASMLLTGSMLDNHLFNIYPGFYYTVALVIAVLLYEKQTADRQKLMSAVENIIAETKSADLEEESDTVNV